MTPRPRPARVTDRAAVLDIVTSCGLFAEGEESLVMDAFDGEAGPEGSGDHLWLVSGDPEAVGAAFFAPEPAGDRVWNLLFLAVAPQGRRQGHGRLLIEAGMSAVGDRDGRLLLVETSDQPATEGARRLYRACGFADVATVPDYYSDGDAKVIFMRRLREPEPD